jgi:hypothetical protein
LNLLTSSGLSMCAVLSCSTVFCANINASPSGNTHTLYPITSQDVRGCLQFSTERRKLSHLSRFGILKLRHFCTNSRCILIPHAFPTQFILYNREVGHMQLTEEWAIDEATDFKERLNMHFYGDIVVSVGESEREYDGESTGDAAYFHSILICSMNLHLIL